MTTLRRSEEEFDARDLRDEYLLYRRESGEIHVLNGTAREILLLCDGRRSESEIAEALAARFDVDSATALEDVAATLTRLLELGAVRRG